MKTVNVEKLPLINQFFDDTLFGTTLEQSVEDIDKYLISPLISGEYDKSTMLYNMRLIREVFEELIEEIKNLKEGGEA